MKLSSLGEFGLIQRLSTVLGSGSPAQLVLGIGDDAAVWRGTPDCLTLATVDSLVEGVHFDLGTTSWEDLGWKALAENLSDIAAMGGAPRYALVGLGLPAHRTAEEAEALYAGMRECAAAFDCHIVGGDTVRSPVVWLHITVIGESLPVRAGSPPILTRSAAEPGDLIAVTGPLGASAAGLRMLQQNDRSSGSARIIAAHLRPSPRVAAGQVLVEAGVRCAIDISDGLLADVGHICERSKVDAEIDSDLVPVDPDAARAFGSAALDLALTGGEDYELVCTGSRGALDQANSRLQILGEAPVTVIGAIVRQAGEHPEVRLREASGELVVVASGGYQHFG